MNTFFHPTELANAGRPLFPGNDVDDQLKRIFKYPFEEVEVFVRTRDTPMEFCVKASSGILKLFLLKAFQNQT